MPILYPASNRFKYARSASDFRARRYAIQNPPPPPFDPSVLFAAMEQGAWYDPSDLSTLYQDSAGTTPVTAVEQPVGLMLDKSKGLVLGSELVTNGTFDTDISGWVVGNTGESTLSWVAGKIRITRVNSGATYPNARTTLSGLVIGRMYKIVTTTNNVFSIEAYHSIFGVAASLVRTTLASKTMECVFTATATTHSLDVGIWTASGAVGQYVEFDNISVKELPGNHAFQTTATSRPVLKQDAGGQYYLRCDGIDDGMVTGTITPGTDKAQVFVGFLPNVSGTAILAELGLSLGVGGMTLHSGYTPGNVSFGLNAGTTSVYGHSMNVGAANLTTGILDIAESSANAEIKMRLNGVARTLSAQSLLVGPAGTGNFQPYPLYLFRRGGTTLPFNGHFYGGIIRFGPNLPIETIEQTEAYMAAKTGVTL